MTVTIIKDVQETETATENVAINVTVDNFVSAKIKYDKALVDLEPVKAQMDGSKKALVAHANDHYEATQELNMQGNDHSVTISPKYREAEMASNEAILDKIGMQNFLAVSKVSVGELKKYCTPDELEDILSYDNTGARRIKVTS
jgi:hypothetical protein